MKTARHHEKQQLEKSEFNQMKKVIQVHPFNEKQPFKNLGLFLREQRRSNELSQGKLAKLLKDIHVQFVSNWERGLCAPPSHCFQRLIDLLNIDRPELVQVMLQDSLGMIEKRVYVQKGKKLKKSA